MEKMNLVRHSMRSILSNTQVRNSGERIVNVIFAKPIDQIGGIDAGQKNEIGERLIYESDPNIKRAVFIAAPHRGCKIATNPIENLTKNFFKYPNAITNAEVDFESAVSPEDLADCGRQIVKHMGSSVHSLGPNMPFFMKTIAQKMKNGVPYHSIIGRADPNDPIADSSDAMGTYSSSHLEGATPENVLHATYNTILRNPDSAEEQRGILFLHAGSSHARTPDEVHEGINHNTGLHRLTQ